MGNWGKKDASIETLRGIAIILMVAGHVVGAEPDDAMQLAAGSPWHFIFWGLQDFRMPLFTVLSGYVYAARPTEDWLQCGLLVRAKIRRLLVPLLVVGTLVFWAKMLNPASSSDLGPGDWWAVYFFGLDHLWFLQAIFLIFLMAGALDALGILGKRRYWLIATLLAAVLYISALVPDTNFLGVSPAIRLLPFFLLGYGLKRHQTKLTNKAGWLLMLALLAAFTTRIVRVTAEVELGTSQERTLAVVIGFTSILLLYRYRAVLTNRFLTWVGGYAFGIYLFHYFALPVVWIGSRTMGIENEFAKFALGMALGIGLPILLQVLTRPSRWAALVLFGEKLSPREPRTVSGRRIAA